MNRGWTVVQAACLAGVAVVGCGGGSGDFLSEANAICREAQKNGHSLRAPKTREDLAPFFDRTLELVTDGPWRQGAGVSRLPDRARPDDHRDPGG
jgi:hypothetical protein